MRARMMIPTILGGLTLLGASDTAIAQVPLSPADTLALQHEGRRSAWIALAQVTAMNGLVWGYNFTFRRKEVFEISPQTFAANLGRTPEWDTNTLGTNHLMHPYNGILYYGAARAEGFGPLAAAGFTLIGSAQWEWMWETVTPSANDLYMTTLGGVTLGESFGRLAASIRMHRPGGLIGVGHGLVAGLMDPGGSLSRWFLGGVTPYDYLHPRIVSRVSLGASSGSLSVTDSEIPEPGSNTRAQVGIELRYGDRFSPRRLSFFDAFELDARLGGGSGSVAIDEIRVTGVMIAGPRTGTGRSRGAAFLDHEFEYSHNPAYSFGTHSFNASYRHRYGTQSGRWTVGARVDARAIPLAGVSSEHANGELSRNGICSEPSGEILRDYDYGSGIGGHLRGTVDLYGREVLRVSYETSWIHTFSGANGNHLLQQLRARATLPITRSWALSAGWELQSRNSDYDDLSDVQRTSSAFSLSATFGAL